uniref:Uncharacterized protein n=1 Tax=Anopheles culicifacies TaxID=139723 RepID=A0A182MTE4_9DIPT
MPRSSYIGGSTTGSPPSGPPSNVLGHVFPTLPANGCPPPPVLRPDPPPNIVATVVPPSDGDLWKERSPGKLSSSSAKSSSDWIGGSESVSRPGPCSSSSYTLSCDRYGSGPGEEQINNGGDRGIGYPLG